MTVAVNTEHVNQITIFTGENVVEEFEKFILEHENNTLMRYLSLKYFI